MAHFFIPSHEAGEQPGEKAAFGAAISRLMVTSGRPVRVGIWGGGPDGANLAVKVFRGSTVVNEGRFPKVTLTRVALDPGNHIQVFAAAGLKQGDELVGMTADGRRWTEPLAVRELTRSARDLMLAWTQAYRAGQPCPDDSMFPDAVPYLALEVKAKGWTMTELSDKCIGSALANVHGLSVHCTGGNDAGTPFQTANNRCVNTWNANGASAHFAISGDGTIVQFIPTSFGANAQHDPGNEHWIAVEIDNNGTSPMNFMQLEGLRSLFRWVCARYAVRPAVATGCLYPMAPAFDAVTQKVCARAGVPTTSSNFEAVLSRGLSCHWWLDPVKTGDHVHHCPGAAIIMQLADVVT